ncbi:MAG: hypothetical protein JW751_16285 [Polyangiaceae bacterium]|nr:hypothetical protein [Polyangiaceae bacterium]
MSFHPHAKPRQQRVELQGIGNVPEYYGRFAYETFGVAYRPGDPFHFEILEISRTSRSFSPRR